jgi:hypothetical protein
MTSAFGAGRRTRAVIALVIAYAVALQLLLPAYALAATMAPAWSVICSADHAVPADGQHKPDKVHCAQCGWDSPVAALPDRSGGLRSVCCDAHATHPIRPAVTVTALVGPRLSQGPPAHADS